jgi:hypothetical protein
MPKRLTCLYIIRTVGFPYLSLRSSKFPFSGRSDLLLSAVSLACFLLRTTTPGRGRIPVAARVAIRIHQYTTVRAPRLQLSPPPQPATTPHPPTIAHAPADDASRLDVPPGNARARCVVGPHARRAPPAPPAPLLRCSAAAAAIVRFELNHSASASHRIALRAGSRRAIRKQRQTIGDTTPDPKRRLAPRVYSSLESRPVA